MRMAEVIVEPLMSAEDVIEDDVRMFGPSAIVTPANALTIVRLLATPMLVLTIATYGASAISFAVWTLLALTDTFDGKLARRQGATRSGAFLDPLADKCILLGALGVLVGDGQFSLVPVGIIAVREVGISIYRIAMGRNGLSVPARPLGKFKAWIQDIAVALALIPAVVRSTGWLPVAVLWVAVMFTLVSGAQYLIDSEHSIRAA